MLNRRQYLYAAALAALPKVAFSQGKKLAIASLKDNATVAGSPIIVKGTGADPAATLEVRVLTTAWFPQDGKGSIASDGTWSYGPVHLGGQGAYNNHTIEVTLVKNSARGESTSVSGIVRR